MFKQLFLVSLLLPSCVYNKQESDDVLKRELPHVETLSNENNNNFIGGCYNFKDLYEITSDGSSYNTQYIVFENQGESKHLVQCSINETTYDSLAYVDSLAMVHLATNCYLTIEYYYSYNDPSSVQTKSITLMDNATIDSLDSWAQTFILYIPNSVFVDDLALDVFRLIFTSEDNENVLTYTGYYSSNNSINSKFTTLGSQVFDNKILMSMNNTNNIQTQTYSEVGFIYYDLKNSSYEIDVYSTPVKNVYFQNVKMTYRSYSALGSYGIFGFVPSSEPTTFKDLIFSVMDAPIYFLSSLLSFELFGVNMFVALTGLLTIAALLLLIRKFF